MARQTIPPLIGRERGRPRKIGNESLPPKINKRDILSPDTQAAYEYLKTIYDKTGKIPFYTKFLQAAKRHIKRDSYYTARRRLLRESRTPRISIDPESDSKRSYGFLYETLAEIRHKLKPEVAEELKVMLPRILVAFAHSYGEAFTMDSIQIIEHNHGMEIRRKVKRD